MKFSTRRLRAFVAETNETLAQLEKSDRSRIAIIAVARVVANALDLIGLVIFAILTIFIFRSSSIASSNGLLNTLISISGLNNLSQTDGILVCASLAASFFILKTLVSMRLLKASVNIVAEAEIRFVDKLTNSWLNGEPKAFKEYSKQTTVFSLLQSLNYFVSGRINATVTIIAEICYILILFIALLFYNPAITFLVALYFGLILVLIQRQVLHRVHKHSTLAAEAWTLSATQIEDILNVYPEISVSGKREFFRKKLVEKRKGLTLNTAETEYLVSIPRFIVEGSLYVGLLLLLIPILFSVPLEVVVKNASIFLVVATRLIPSLLPLQQATTNLRIAINQGSAARRFVNEFGTSGNNTKTNEFKENNSVFLVQLKNVNLNKQNNEPILKDINFEVRPNQYVSIVGSSGSGKTTLIESILGLHKPDGGSINTMGQDPHKLLKFGIPNVSYVPQDVYLIEGTIKENLLLGNEESISDEEILQVLNSLNLYDRYQTLPNGLETSIGSAQEKFSGGEIQRIGIARALLTKPKLLILDEATSALDPITETTIQTILADRSKISTVIAVAHRINTVISSSHIIYMQNGQISAQGTFDQLITESPEFAAQIETMKLNDAN